LERLSPPADSLREALGRELGARGYELVDLVGVPATADRLVRVRTLDEIIGEFETDGGGAQGASFVIHVRRRVEAAAFAETFERAAPPKADRLPGAIYQTDGKLNVPYLEGNAEILMKAGEHRLARNIYQAILQSGERRANAHLGLGRTLVADRDDSGAQGHFEESIAYQPSLEAYRELAGALMRQRKDAYAAEVLERSLKLEGLSAEARRDLHRTCAAAWGRADRHDRAEAQFRKAIETDPKADEAMVGLGSALLASGREAEARRCFQDALAVNPRNDRAQVGLGSCHLSEGKVRAAHDCFAKALELEIQNPTAIYHLIRCAYDLRQYAVACALVAKYVETGPVNASLIFSLAGLYFHMGRYREAGAAAKKVISMKPDHSGARELLDTVKRLAGP